MYALLHVDTTKCPREVTIFKMNMYNYYSTANTVTTECLKTLDLHNVLAKPSKY